MAALDFTGLFNSPQEAPERPRNAFKVVKANDEPLPQNALQKRIEAQRATIARAEEITRERAEQIRRSEALRAELMQSLNAGADSYELLVKAAELVKLLTGDEVFYNHAKEAAAQHRQGGTA